MSKAFQENLDSLNLIWKNMCTTYINTKAESEIDKTSNVNSQAMSNLVNTYGKYKSLDAKLTGSIDGLNNNLSDVDGEIQLLKSRIGNDKQELINQININNSSGRLKTDKYNYNSKTYIQASFYVLSISTITFFIYKQLKQ